MLLIGQSIYGLGFNLLFLTPSTEALPLDVVGHCSRCLMLLHNGLENHFFLRCLEIRFMLVYATILNLEGVFITDEEDGPTQEVIVLPGHVLQWVHFWKEVVAIMVVQLLHQSGRSA